MRSIGGEDSGRTLRETVRVIGIKSKEYVEMTSILIFKLDGGKKKFELYPTREWSTFAYNGDDRNTLMKLTNETVEFLKPTEIVYSIPLEIVTKNEITNVNIVFKSWDPYFLCCVGIKDNIEANQVSLQLSMINYYNKMIDERSTSLLNKTGTKNKEFNRSLKNGSLFLKHFKIELPAQGGRRKSRRTHRKSKRSKRTRRHRK
jgi:hypothetical protein